jgi:hypothetical protein
MSGNKMEHNMKQIKNYYKQLKRDKIFEEQRWRPKTSLQHLSTTYCDRNIIVHTAHLDLHDVLCNLNSH